MKLKYLILVISIFFNFFPIANAQEESEVFPANIGLSMNVLGPIFGIYSLGVTTFVTSRMQIGLDGVYYSTRDFDPKVEGWQAKIRMNYFFSPLYKSGFYLGLAGGFESVKVTKDSSKSTDTYEDPIGGIIPGYRWVLSRSLNMMLGVYTGYEFGGFQLTPELAFIFVF